MTVWCRRLGYYPNSSKTRLLVKEQFKVDAMNIFKDSGIQISVEGCEYLGGSIGSESFIQKAVDDKVASWLKEIDLLSGFADAHNMKPMLPLPMGF